MYLVEPVFIYFVYLLLFCMFLFNKSLYLPLLVSVAEVSSVDPCPAYLKMLQLIMLAMRNSASHIISLKEFDHLS